MLCPICGLRYDGIYTTTAGADHWNATGVWVKGLQASDVVHFVHLDGNLWVDDSADGTVFVNFMIQGSLNVSGTTQQSPGRPYPPCAAATMVGLTDHDLTVNDDQSVVITDFYSEQIKTAHVTLTGSGGSGVGGTAKFGMLFPPPPTYTHT